MATDRVPALINGLSIPDALRANFLAVQDGIVSFW